MGSGFIWFRFNAGRNYEAMRPTTPWVRELGRDKLAIKVLSSRSKKISAISKVSNPIQLCGHRKRIRVWYTLQVKSSMFVWSHLHWWSFRHSCFDSTFNIFKSTIKSSASLNTYIHVYIYRGEAWGSPEHGGTSRNLESLSDRHKHAEGVGGDVKRSLQQYYITILAYSEDYLSNSSLQCSKWNKLYHLVI